MRARRAALLPVGWLLAATTVLAGCSASSPEARLTERLNDITVAANDRDADGVRSAVEAFLAEVRAQSRDGMPSSRVTRLTELAQRVLAGADLIDERVAEVEASRSAAAAAEASRQAEARAEASRQAAEAAAQASREAAAAEASRSAAASSPTPEPEPEPTPEPTGGGGVVPTGQPGDRQVRPSPTR